MLLLVSMGSVMAQGAGKIVRLSGIIIDHQCRNPTGNDEELPCDANDPAEGAELVFLDAKGEVHLIEDQEEARGHVGREISIFGLQRGDRKLWFLDITKYMDPVGDALVADAAEAGKAKSAKGVLKPKAPAGSR